MLPRDFDRRSDRIRSPAPEQRGGSTRVGRRHALVLDRLEVLSAAGPGRDFSGGNAGSGHHRGGADGGGNGASGIGHAAHQRRGADYRPDYRRVPGTATTTGARAAFVDLAGGDRATASAQSQRQRQGIGDGSAEKRSRFGRPDPRRQDAPTLQRHRNGDERRDDDAGCVPDQAQRTGPDHPRGRGAAHAQPPGSDRRADQESERGKIVRGAGEENFQAVRHTFSFNSFDYVTFYQNSRLPLPL